MKNNASVAIVGIVGIPANYGGFESLVENLVSYKSKNVDYTVFCSAKSYKHQLDTYNGAKLNYINIEANGVQSILYDIISMIKCIRIRPDTILILGVSGCLFLPLMRLFTNSKIITNIDGLEWKREKWGWLAKKFLKLSEKFAITFSDEIIADNQVITDYVYSQYGKESKTIAYGGDHAVKPGELRDCFTSSRSYSLGLCRIEPENNVEMILNAFKLSDNNLKFIGNWNASKYGRELKDKFGHECNIELLDPIYDLNELFELRSNCNIYIHGHSAGGTNPSLVEMMHFGVPILAYDCSFNRESTRNKAHYFKESRDLCELISQISVKDKLENASSMKKIAAKYYTWSVISNSYEELY